MTPLAQKLANSPAKKIHVRAIGARAHARIRAYAYACHTHIRDKEIDKRTMGYPMTPPVISLSSGCHGCHGNSLRRIKRLVGEGRRLLVTATRALPPHARKR